MTTNVLYNFVKLNKITKPLFVGYCIVFSVIFYFLFFIFFGDKGLIEYFSLKSQIANREATKQELLSKMQAKKNMVDGISLDSLDLDLLDEQSRKVLGYVGKDELVIYQDKTKEVKNEPAN